MRISKKRQRCTLQRMLCSVLCFALLLTFVTPTALAADGVRITGIAPTPYVRTDGHQETTLSVDNSGTAFSAWAKVTVGNWPAKTVQVGNIGAGSSRVTLLVPDTNSLLSPGETTALQVTLYDNADCTGAPVATYTDPAWGRTRHWEFYLSQEMHTDLGYTAYQEDLKEIYSGYLDTVKEYMQNSDNRATDLQKFKYGIESGFMLGESYMTHRNADELGDLLELIDAGRMTVYAGQFNYTMENFGAEETARAAYYTNRYLVDALGIRPSTTINMFDNPSFSKSFVDIAASAGIKYGVHSMNASRSPYHQVREYDLYYMQGNDPENKLLIFNGRGYSENYGFGGTHFDNSGGVADAKKSILNLIADLESRTGRRTYPYDKFLMPLVPFGDNRPPMEDQIITANALNKELADAGYAYPRVTVAFSDDFFQAIEAEYAGLIPLESGTEENWWNDGWGTTAYESGVNKQAGNRIPVAETLSAFAALFAGEKYPYNDIAEAVERNLIYDEHTWGYAIYDDYNWQYDNQFEWKRSNALGASALAEKLAGNALNALAGTVKTEGQAVYVYNQLNWTRNDLVTLTDLSALPENFAIMDGDVSVPYSITDGVLTFVAENVPPIGYKVFDILPVAKQPTFTADTVAGENTIENAYYKVTFAPDGTVASIIDRQNGNRELVDASAEEKFNQYRYYDDHGIPAANQWVEFSEDKWDLYVPQESASALEVAKTAFGATATLKTGTFRAGNILQKVTLYDDIPRIDIENVVVKDALPSLQSKEEAFYTFPFKTGEEYEIRYDLPLGNAAEGEQVYGTSTDFYTVNKWVGVTDEADDFNMVLATPNTGLFQFGQRRTGQWSFDYRCEHPYIYSYIMNNQWETNFQGDQPGWVTFNYSISTNRSEDVAKTAKFGWEINSPLEATVITSAQSGTAQSANSLIQIDNEHVILTTMKTAEANSDGMILRFHEMAGKGAKSVKVTLPFQVDSVYATDIIENDEKQIAGAGNTFTVDLPAYGMQTVRIRFDEGPKQVTGLTAITHQTGEGANLALRAAATASSTYSGEYSADNAKSGGNQLEWASAGEQNAWYQLNWAQPVTVGSIRLYDRPNGTDNIQSVKLIFSDGSSVQASNIPVDGSVKEILLDAPKTTTYIKAEITGTAGTWNVGLSGMEVYASAAAKISGTMLSWDTDEDALYYEIFRSADPNFTAGSGSYLGVSESGHYFDAQVVEGLKHTYYYRVRAVAAGAKGTASAAVAPSAGVVTDNTAPDVPILHVQAREGDRIDLYWTPVEDHIAISRYDIYRDGVKVGETHDGYICTYRDTDLQPAKTYKYTVRAVDPNGMTAASNTVTAQTLDTVTATLTDLRPSAGLLSPSFDPQTQNYFLNIGSVPVNSVRITPVADAGVQIQVNGQPVENGKLSQSIAIQAGTTACIQVTEGTTTRFYTLYVSENAPVIQPVSATAGDEYAPSAGAQAPHKVIDGDGMTGYGVTGKHDANGSAFSMWHTGANPGTNAWFRVDLGEIYTLDEMYIWNINQYANTARGMKNVKIQYSEDGVSWQELAPEEGMTFQGGNADYPFQFAQGSGENALPATNLNDGKNTPVRFGGATARYVKITAAPTPGDGSWGDVYYGLSELRFTAMLTAEDVTPVESITVTAAEDAITKLGGSLQMQAAVLPRNATKPDVVWRVVDQKGDPSPAAVISADGLLSARANGTVTVIAASTDGTRVQGKMTVTITGQPTVITGVTAVSGNDYDGMRAAGRVVDASGMSGTVSIWDTHDNHNHAETMWHTGANPGDTAWIEFDLGSVREVGEMYVWNMNQNGGTDRGLKNIKIEYKREANDAWTELRGADAGDGEYPYTLAQADGSSQLSATNLVGGKPVQLGVNARYIRITAGSSYGGDYWGVSEVRFTESAHAPGLMGDVDTSGTVDVADIMKLKALIMADKWSQTELAVGDMDVSGRLDVGDIMAIKNIIMSR